MAILGSAALVISWTGARKEGVLRVLSISACLLLTALSPSNASDHLSCEIKWPNPDIAVPAKVRAYIAWECGKYQGQTGESFADCVRGERYGYRAVVGMLSDPETGDRAAERYRACAAGLGDFGGRFHRRRAECIGGSLRIVWRFEDSRHAASERDAVEMDVTSLSR